MSYLGEPENGRASEHCAPGNVHTVLPGVLRLPRLAPAANTARGQLSPPQGVEEGEVGSRCLGRTQPRGRRYK